MNRDLQPEEVAFLAKAIVSGASHRLARMVGSADSPSSTEKACLDDIVSFGNSRALLGEFDDASDAADQTLAAVRHFLEYWASHADDSARVAEVAGDLACLVEGCREDTRLTVADALRVAARLEERWPYYAPLLQRFLWEISDTRGEQ